MTWLTWRQFRVPAGVILAAVIVIGIILAISGASMSGGEVFADLNFLYSGMIVVSYLLPAIIGIFWGAPLVTRELEAGTQSLVWNQTVTRRRWLATKLGAGVAAAVLSTGLLCLVVSWLGSPINEASGVGVAEARISPLLFGARGFVPVGYASFAFVLGVAIGLVLRRTVTAMAVTLVVFAAVQLTVPFLARPYFMPPVEETVAITEQSVGMIRAFDAGVDSIGVREPADVWVLTNETIAPTGNVATVLPTEIRGCLIPRDVNRGAGETMQSCIAGLNDLGYHQRLVYQPNEHFWPLQWIETGMFLALTALLAWFSFRRIRHLS
ncbi:ABC-2 transporter permease [Actinophytocola sediminis]